jgi:hypothetical protein
MGVGVVVEQVLGHRVDDFQRHLSAARAVEVGYRPPGLATLERREAPSDRFHIGRERRGARRAGRRRSSHDDGEDIRLVFAA